jgi:uncharacterized hydrophobic protein (TIGR00271 family)
MTVAVFVNDVNDVATIVPWGTRFADAKNTDLLIVVPKRSAKKEGWNELTPDSVSTESPIHQAIFEAFDQLDPARFAIGSPNDTEDLQSSNQIRVQAKELIGANPNASLVQQVEELNISLLLIDADEPALRSSDAAGDDPLDIFFDSQCQTMVVRGKPKQTDEPLRILVVAEKEGHDSDIAIKSAFDLLRDEEGRVTFLYVRPDDDEVAEQVGLVSANRLINRLYNLRHNVECRVSLADKMLTGIQSQKDLDKYDLVIIAARNSASGYKFVRAWEKEERTNSIPLAMIKGKVPLSTRLWGKVTRAVRSVVPQMDREHRVNLVDRLQNNSKWDFDFIALISLSTLIAALGLVRNSGAVVIGAMLVAPLMTPLVGIGFALVQGNNRLIRQSLKSLSFGFALAFVIGLVVGVAVHFTGFDELKDIASIPAEMLSRGSPNFLDLVVALVSGVAGAYAMGRPNLISALPGVAIAAALVPPIATSGMALSLLDYKLWGGSLLLFFTNIVAITLGCAIVFWAVGIDTRVAQKSKSGDDRKAQLWPRYVFVVFVVLSIVLAATMHAMNGS